LSSFSRELDGDPDTSTNRRDKPVKILKAFMVPACVLSMIWLLAGCGHVINRMI
jgi:hypothetical protein